MPNKSEPLFQSYFFDEISSVLMVLIYTHAVAVLGVGEILIFFFQSSLKIDILCVVSEPIVNPMISWAR